MVLRQALGLTRAEFAEKLGVTEEAVSRWEAKGGPPPTAEQVAALETLRATAMRSGIAFDGERRE